MLRVAEWANNANTRSEAHKRALERQNKEFKGFIPFALGMLVGFPIMCLIIGIVEAW